MPSDSQPGLKPAFELITAWLLNLSDEVDRCHAAEIKLRMRVTDLERAATGSAIKKWN